MTKVKTTETLLRLKNFSFTETRKTDDGEMDVYSAATGTEIRVLYDSEGVPADIMLCAPDYNIDEIVILAQSDTPLVEDAREALLYELVDGEQMMFRMSGVTEDDPEPEMV